MKTEGSTATFRSSFWFVTIFVAIVANSIAIPLALLILAFLPYSSPGVNVLLVDFAVAVGGGEIATVLLVLGAVAYFKIYVKPAGLGAYNPWGLYRQCAWQDIVAVRAVNILGLRYLRMRVSGKSSTISVPLFLSDREGFYVAVRRYAGPEHPLTVAWHEHMGR